jgi:hypothetical protein
LQSSGPVIGFKPQFQNSDIRLRFLPLLAEDIQNAAHSLADILTQFLDRFTLGVASRQSRNFRPETTGWIFVDDHGIGRHSFTLAQ